MFYSLLFIFSYISIFIPILNYPLHLSISIIVNSGETNHAIPRQTDHGFNWRTEVVNAVEGLSKVVV